METRELAAISMCFANLTPFPISDLYIAYIIVGSIGLCTSMVFACVIFAHAARMNMNQLLFPSEEAAERHTGRHILLTLSFVASAVGITCAVDDISDVLSCKFYLPSLYTLLMDCIPDTIEMFRARRKYTQAFYE